MSLLLFFPLSGPVPLSGNDSATSQDSGVVATTAVESAAGVDGATLAATATASDSVVGVDAFTLIVTSSSTESAGGFDVAQPTVLPATESVESAEGTSLLASLSAVESAGSTEAVGLGVLPQETESGVGTDGQSLDVVVFVADVANGIDASVLAASVLSSDVGVGTDVAVVAAIVTGLDLAISADSALVSATPASTDTAQAVDAVLVMAAVAVADAALAVESSGLGITNAVADTDLAFGADAGHVAALTVDGDTASGADAAVLTVLTAEAGASTSSEVVALTAPADSTVVVESVLVTQQVLAADLASGVEDVAILQQVSVTESVLAADATTLALQDVDTASSTDSETVLVIYQVSAHDSATGTDTATPSLPPPPRSVFDIESPSVVEILRSVSTRTNGSARVQWLPLAQLVGGELFALSPGHTAGASLVGGQLAVRFDLHFVQPGAALPAPPVAGFLPDRTGVLFADVSAVGLLKAGDRVRCLSGPIDGTFEIRVIPDVAVGYSTGHHVEVEVVEVAQRGGGSYIAPLPNLAGVTSFMRPLYDTRVRVLRRQVVTEHAGSARESWPAIPDVPDVTWGVPGEMWCRLALRFLRRGKDQPPPVVAGRAPDRIGVLYCDVTPHLRAGDRVRCVQGPIAGTFELRVAPDLSPDLFTVHHLEVQVIETAQSLAGVYPRAGGG